MRTIRVRAALPGVRPLPAPPRVTVPAAMTLTSMLVPAATTASPSVPLISAPVGSGSRQKLECTDMTGGREMGAATEIDELALAVG